MSLDKYLKEINKKFGSEDADGNPIDIMTKGIPTRYIDEEGYNIIPFTSPAINMVLYGGIPRGKITELAGSEGASKTTLAIDLCKNAIEIIKKEKRNQKILYIDVETTLDRDWARLHCPEFDDYAIVVTPDGMPAEEIFEIAKGSMETGEVMLCVLDSVGQLYSLAESNKGMEGETMGGIAKPLTKFVKFTSQICSKYNTTFIAINQVRDNVSGYGKPTTTVGGNAFRHSCSIRLELRRFEFFDEKFNKLTTSAENPYGHTIKVTLIKSKFKPSNRKLGIYTLVYTEGIDVIKDTIAVGKYFGAVRQSGAWYEVLDLDTGEVVSEKVQGEPNLRKILEEDKKLFDKLSSQINKKIKEVNYNIN